MEHLVGQSFDRYRLVTLLGEGGMGAVFKAHDLTLRRDVAVKVMHPQCARRKDFQARFLQEAQTAARLDHPGVVRVFDFGEAASHLYLVMEFIPGDNLREMIDQVHADHKRVLIPDAAYLVSELCLAVDYAHEQGVLHRDIKPANIMLRPRPGHDPPYRPVLTDLGLAKLVEGGLMTVEGTSMGTPAYMSPEQALGEETDARSDVYSLGILLFELAVGQRPFPANTITQAIRYHVKEPPPLPRSLRDDLPEPLERVILRAMEKEPNGRYASAKAMAVALGGAVSAPAPGQSPSMDPGTVSLLVPHHKSLAKTPMSQARLVITPPDGRSRSVPLTGEAVTVGRANDNSVTLLDDGRASRYHARIEFDGTNYQVIDRQSTNGTSVGDKPLLPGVPERVLPGQPITMGKHKLHIERIQEDPEPDYWPPEPVQPREQAPTPDPERVSLDIESPELFVDPGSVTTARFTVLNLSPLVDHFDFSVSGVPSDWVHLPIPNAQLMPDSHQTVEVILRPPRTPQCRAGTHPLTIRASSREFPDQVAQIGATLAVSAFHHMELDMRPLRQSGVGSGRFKVQVSNQGNTPLTVHMQAVDPEDAFVFTFEPAQLVVQPARVQQATLQVRPRTPLPGATPRPCSFTVTASPLEAPDISRQIQGEWVQVPPAFALALQPRKQSRAKEGLFKVSIYNEGSADLTLQLAARDPEDACQYSLSNSQVVVPAGQRRTLELRVRSRKPLAGDRSKPHSFTVFARPAEAPALVRQTQGSWLELPGAQLWKRVVLPILLTTVGWIGAWLVGVLVYGFAARIITGISTDSAIWAAREVVTSLGGTAFVPYIESIGRNLVGFVVAVAIPAILLGLVIGIVGGLMTALALHVAERTFASQLGFRVTRSWALWWAIVLLVLVLLPPEVRRESLILWAGAGALVGLLGGLGTARALQRAMPAVSPVLVALGWTFAWAAGGVLFWAMGGDLFWAAGVDLLRDAIAPALQGFVAGAIGALVMFWHLHRVRPRPQK